MDSTLIIAATTLGLVSSLHCVGMCGPIAFSLGLKQENVLNGIAKNFVYQLGRAFTYSVLGVFIGLIGAGFTLAGFQNKLSILAGVIMIMMVFVPKNIEKYISPKNFIGKLLIQIKTKLSYFIMKKSYFSFFITGLLNGLLPCGVVYIALVAALASGTPMGSGIFMFLFGLGTIPLMFITAFVGSALNVKFRSQVMKVLPYVTVIVGIVFILRGMSLGIPYLSPPEKSLQTTIQKADAPKHHCH